MTTFEKLQGPKATVLVLGETKSLRSVSNIP